MPGERGAAGPPGATGPAGPQGPPGQGAVVDYERIVREVVTALKTDQSFQDAIRGAPGKDAEVDLEDLIAGVLANLPPVRVQIWKDLDRDGKITNDDGQVVYTIPQDKPTSEVYEQQKRLGEAIRIVISGKSVQVTGR